MKTFMKLFFFILLIRLTAVNLEAQYAFFSPADNFAIEVSLPNTSLKRLPIYRNSISSLIVIRDHIIGGTSAKEGLTPYIFVASLKQHQVIETLDMNEIIPGQRAIPSGFCRGKNNTLFAGTMSNKAKDGSASDMGIFSR